MNSRIELKGKNPKKECIGDRAYVNVFYGFAIFLERLLNFSLLLTRNKYNFHFLFEDTTAVLFIT